jgi:hypothetical protein
MLGPRVCPGSALDRFRSVRVAKAGALCPSQRRLVQAWTRLRNSSRRSPLRGHLLTARELEDIEAAGSWHISQRAHRTERSAAGGRAGLVLSWSDPVGGLSHDWASADQAGEPEDAADRYRENHSLSWRGMCACAPHRAKAVVNSTIRLKVPLLQRRHEDGRRTVARGRIRCSTCMTAGGDVSWLSQDHPRELEDHFQVL